MRFGSCGRREQCGRCSCCVFVSEDQFVSFSLAAGGAVGLAAVRLSLVDVGSSVGRCSCCVFASVDQFGSLIQQRAVLLVRPLCVWIRFWIRFGSSGSGLGVFFCQSGSFLSVDQQRAVQFVSPLYVWFQWQPGALSSQAYSSQQGAAL